MIFQPTLIKKKKNLKAFDNAHKQSEIKNMMYNTTQFQKINVISHQYLTYIFHFANMTWFGRNLGGKTKIHGLIEKKKIQLLLDYAMSS